MANDISARKVLKPGAAGSIKAALGQARRPLEADLTISRYFKGSDGSTISAPINDQRGQRILELMGALQTALKSNTTVSIIWNDSFTGQSSLTCSGKVFVLNVNGGYPIVRINTYKFGINIADITHLNGKSVQARE